METKIAKRDWRATLRPLGAHELAPVLVTISKNRIEAIDGLFHDAGVMSLPLRIRRTLSEEAERHETFVRAVTELLQSSPDDRARATPALIELLAALAVAEASALTEMAALRSAWLSSFVPN